MNALQLGGAPLCVVLDIRQPLAYLALRPAIDFGRELGIDVDWLPYEGPPLRAPAAADAGDDRTARHKQHRAAMIAREVAVYADARGLTLREPYRDGSPHGAHLAWLWMRLHAPESLPAFLEEIFRRYWALELDAASLADAAALVDDVGSDGSGFVEWAGDGGAREAERVAVALRDANVYQTPAYLVGDERFYGRQHLPMIRWILGGRAGKGPI